MAAARRLPCPAGWSLQRPLGWSSCVFWCDETRKEFPVWLLIFLTSITQDTGVGANPVQIEVGDFDEAIEIVEDEVVESKLNWNQQRK